MTRTSDFYSFRHGEDKNDAQIHPVQTRSSKGVLAADEVAFAPSSTPLIVTSDEVVLTDGGARDRKCENSVPEANLSGIFARSSHATLVGITLANRLHISGLVFDIGSLSIRKCLRFKEFGRMGSLDG